MTPAEFIAIFTRHLRVAEPKRSSLLSEIQSHISELETNEDPVRTLGYPMDLARTYNRTHIGPLGSKGVLFSLPALYTLIVWVSLGATGPYFTKPYFLQIAFGYIPLLAFLLMCSFVGAALRRTHYPVFSFLGLIASSLISSTILLLVIQYFAWVVDPGLGSLGGIFGQSHGDPPLGYPFPWAYNFQQTLSLSLAGTGVAVIFASLAYFVFSAVEKFGSRVFSSQQHLGDNR